MRLLVRNLIIGAIIMSICIGYRLFCAKSQRLNIILITLDATRADHLGCYGYRRATSYNIDKLSREGLIFDQAITQAPWTASAVSSLMTSLYPIRHGVNSWNKSLNPKTPTLAKILNKSGYNTAAIFPPLLENLARDYGFSYRLTAEPASNVTNGAINWISNNKAKPFFLWLHYFDPHSPYTPPEPFDNKFIGDELYNREARVLPFNKKGINTDNENWGDGGIPEIAQIGQVDRMNFYVSRYDGEIAYTDREIGILIDALKDFRIYANTIIIITADHGEMMGEHNVYFTHAKYLFEDLIRVPLIFKSSSLLFKGKRMTRQVQSVDIMPSVLHLLGIKRPQGISGISLFSPWDLIKEKIYGRPAYSMESFNNGISIVSARNKRWKMQYLFSGHAGFSVFTLSGLLERLNLKTISKNLISKSLSLDNKTEQQDLIINSAKDRKYNFFWFHAFDRPYFIPFPSNLIYLSDINYFISLNDRDTIPQYDSSQVNAVINGVDNINNRERNYFLLTQDRQSMGLGSECVWKLFFRGTRMPGYPLIALYDLRSDMAEKNNLSGNPKYRKIEDKLMSGITDYLKQGIRPEASFTRELTQVERERLKSLGYAN